MRKSIYYGMGIFCLAASAMILLNTNILPLNIANSISQAKYDSEYKEYYHIGFPMPRNSLRQGTVYLPVYYVREVEELREIMAPFGMDGAEIIENDEYFEAAAHGRVLRIYRYIDLLEYEGFQASGASELIDEDMARQIAEEFMENFLLYKGPYKAIVRRDNGGWAVSFFGQLGGLENRAFPTEIILDAYGDIVSATHYFFEYEALGAADVITVRAALAKLPREGGRRVHLKGYELEYGFEDSVLVPVYRFYGKCADSVDFEEFVGAMKFY